MIQIHQVSPELVDDDVRAEVPEEVVAREAARPTLPGALFVRRGFVAVPTEDVRAFVSDQAVVFGTGIAIGVAVGVAFGNIFGLFGRGGR